MGGGVVYMRFFVDTTDLMVYAGVNHSFFIKGRETYAKNHRACQFL
jgi:hypothetical protein